MADAPLAAIFGTAGPSLTSDERAFFTKVKPAGYILFARNIETPEQVKALTADLRALTPGFDPVILIDQEGGRVQRLRPPHWRFAPPAADFGKLFASDQAAARKATRLNMRLIGTELAELGIDVDCAPVVDVPVEGAHDIIGDRAYGRTPDVVAALAGACCEGLIDAGVIPVIKHIPGHGRAASDSHLELPVVETDLASLRATDFAAFKLLVRDTRVPMFGMTAHVVYRAIDPAQPATQSANVIADIIRGEIGFEGLLMTDDLSMKALSGSFEDRTARSMTAGCDVALHCNGDMAEMVAIAGACGKLGARGQRALEESAAIRRKPRSAPASVALDEVHVTNLLRRV